ncbi:MAG: citryl-CoA lyase [Candidatus Delongbacteria bacterium]|nr:citryl-CoA lyase [Candidatus Delongbacteria bacterium]
MSNVPEWSTKITDTAGGKIAVRGYDIADIIENLTFAETIYLIIKGELPDKREKRMIEGLLASSIDHGITPPSNLAARTVLSGGNSLNTAVAAGIMAIGDSHGGAIEQCARILQEAVAQEKSAEELVAEFKVAKKRFPGFGHRIHRRDPRTIKLLELAEQTGFAGPHIELAVTLQDLLEAGSGRDLPLNVDGAIAAIMSEMGFDWRLGKGFFIIARTPGLVAHVFEEWSTQKRMRKLGPLGGHYEGFTERKIPPATER